MKRTLYILLLLLCPLFFVQCQKDETAGVGEEVDVTFTARISDVQFSTRAEIGSGSNVDVLSVGLYDTDGTLVWRKDNVEISTGTSVSVVVPMFKNKRYNVVFWAQSSDCNAFDTSDLTAIKVDYSQHSNAGYTDIEHLDAFYASKNSITHNDANKVVSLTRPFTQLNMGVPEDLLKQVKDAGYEIKVAKITVSGIADTFCPLSGVAVCEDQQNAHEFVFTDFPDEKLETGGQSFNYLGTAYLFASGNKLNVKLEVYKSKDDDEPFSSYEYNDIEVEANERTNLTGNLVKVPILYWNGKDEIKPVVEDGICLIKNPDNYVYIANYGTDGLDNFTEIRLMQNMDFGEKSDGALVKPFKIPDNSIFNGNGKTIKNLNVDGYSIFTGATGATVKDLNIDGAVVGNDNSTIDSHVGTLVNHLKGGAIFSSIGVTGSTIKTGKGAAGGFVGYISRSTESNRGESYTVEFNNCSIDNSSISGTVASGKFVGLMCGYDGGEKLVFSKECEVGATATVSVNMDSPYKSTNKSTILSGNECLTTCDGWLGNEKYIRGKIYFGGNDETYRFIRRWDGQTIVEPMLANATYDTGVTAGTNKFVVYSPFDLAGVRKKTASPAAIFLRADIDMFGQGSDGKYNVPSNFEQSAYSSTDDNNFNPFSYVTTLDGKKSDAENFSIYNLGISQIEQDRAAFILYASGTTSHKNINFRNCQTVAVHKVVTTDAKAYGAILISNVDATSYTMENVHAYDCKVFALQKIGTLGARISGTSTLKNNSVNNCYVENYRCDIEERFESGSKTINGFTIDNVYADFYPHGEVGGMYGFIQGNSALTSCKVNTTEVFAYGQDDKMAEIKASGWKGAVAVLTVKGLGYYLVPGRHVSTLIGNIRATGTVTLTSCAVDSNSKCTNRWDKHNSIYNYIGQAYIVKFLDSEGTVTVDGKKLTIADCNKNTKL